MEQQENSIDRDEGELSTEILDIIAEYEDLLREYEAVMRKTSETLDDISAKEKELEEKGILDEKIADDLEQKRIDALEELGDTEARLMTIIIERKQKEVDEVMAEKRFLEAKYHRAKRVNEKLKYGHKLYPNDPCPCGSGKKYKKCCGKVGE